MINIIIDLNTLKMYIADVIYIELKPKPNPETPKLAVFQSLAFCPWHSDRILGRTIRSAVWSPSPSKVMRALVKLVCVVIIMTNHILW